MFCDYSLTILTKIIAYKIKYFIFFRMSLKSQKNIFTIKEKENLFKNLNKKISKTGAFFICRDEGITSLHFVIPERGK